LFGKSPVVGACGVKVGICSFGAGAECVSGFFKGGDACVGGGGELVQCLPVVGADAGGLVGCGDLGPVCLLGVVLGLRGACGGVGDLAGGLVSCGAAVAVWSRARRSPSAASTPAIPVPSGRRPAPKLIMSVTLSSFSGWSQALAKMLTCWRRDHRGRGPGRLSHGGMSHREIGVILARRGGMMSPPRAELHRRRTRVSYSSLTECL
jgi:hypothetical protein